MRHVCKSTHPDGEKREFPMKKLLMPATALSRKKVAFTIACCVLLMWLAAPAWAQTETTYTDPCTPALNVGVATGCGAIITVTADNGTGQAIAFTVAIPNNGNGNPYDGDDD